MLKENTRRKRTRSKGRGSMGWYVALVFALAFGVALGAYVQQQNGASMAQNVTLVQYSYLNFTDIFEEIEPSVVAIQVSRGEIFGFGSGEQGSGFVWDDQGYIITNNHVIRKGGAVQVRFLDGKILAAEVVGTDPGSDIAVLKVDYDQIVPIALGSSAQLRVGEPVIAVGNPFGLSGTMTSGIVSQIGRRLNTEGGFSLPNIIQIDAAVNPGNSGGPLLNSRGEVIGINTAISSTTGTFSGVGFSIPIDTVKKVVAEILEKGGYDHPWLGITGTDVSPAILKRMELNDSVKGFLVISVVEGGPAESAGVRGSDKDVQIGEDVLSLGGDIIVGIDGTNVRGIDDLLVYLQENTQVGQEATLQVVRDGEVVDVPITLGARP